MATELPRYRARLMGDAGSADLSLARSYETLSDTLFQFSQKVSGIAQQERKEEAEAILTGVKTDAMRDAGKIAETVGYDYSTYESQQETYIEEKLKDVPDYLQGQARSAIEYQFTLKGQPVFKKFVDWNNQTNIQKGREDISALADNIGATFKWGSELYADNLGDEFTNGVLQNDILEDFNDINNILDKMATYNGMTFDQKDELRKETTQQILNNFLRGEIEVQSDKGNASQYVLDIVADPQRFFQNNPLLKLLPEDSFSEEDLDTMAEFASDHWDDLKKRKDEIDSQLEKQTKVKQENNYVNILDKKEKGFTYSPGYLKKQYSDGEINLKMYESLLFDLDNDKFIDNDPSEINKIYEMQANDMPQDDIIEYIINSKSIKIDKKNQLIKEMRSETDTDFNFSVKEANRIAGTIVDRSRFGNIMNPMQELNVLKLRTAINRKQRELEKLDITDDERINKFNTWFENRFQEARLNSIKLLKGDSGGDGWDASILGPKDADNIDYDAKEELVLKMLDNEELTKDKADELLNIIGTYRDAERR